MLKKLSIYYLFVSLPFAFLLVGAVFFFDAIKLTITRNPHPQINYTIFVIILVGGVIILLNARRLVREAKVLIEFSRAIHAKTNLATLREMANGYTVDISCLLQMVAASGNRTISHQEQVAIEHELTNARARLIRRNALPQYLTGLLVGMGLLGTFIGLLATLNDISVLISSFADIDMQNASPLLVFRTMIERMKAPMQSMGIAFSASMFGLLGSIILGLMMVGIRRLQGDIFSMLSSEIARHIEMALSHENITYGSGMEYSGDISDIAKVMIRVEERLAEGARVQQRALSSVIEDFQKQRVDMLRTFTQQTEANNNFHSELQQLVSQLGSIFTVMEKGNGEISAQISELTVHMIGDARETHKLLAMQVDEQTKLRADLDSYKIEERLAEAGRMQQRVLASVIDDFQKQRADMLRALAQQTEANNNLRSELQQLGGQLGAFSNIVVKGNDEISGQISELTVHMSADAKESHILLNTVNNNFRSELQQIGSQLDSQLGTISDVTEQGNAEISTRISELIGQVAAAAKESHKLIGTANNDFRSELQQLGTKLGSQLGTISNVTEQGNTEISTRVSELMGQMAAAAKESHKLIDAASNDFRSELQQLGSQLGTIFNATEQGNTEICTRVSELMGQMTASAKESHKLIDAASHDFRSELQQLGSQLGTISNATEQGNAEISARISELMGHMTAATRGSHELFGNASNNFCSELQQLGTVMEKGNDEICTQLFELMRHMAAAAKGSNELLAVPVDERSDQEQHSIGVQE